MGSRSEASTTMPTRLGRAVLLHESEHTRISRVVLHDGTVIRKEPLGPDAPARLRHEHAILKRLAGAYGVVQLAPLPAERGALLLVDTGGTSLARKTTPLAMADLIPLAQNLARAVAAIHRRQIIHRDINPANIVVAGHHPYLIDFTLATTFAELRPVFTHHNDIIGTLPYLAPEVTGRTGRPVDQRADLYALGATLYELATGNPPFGTGDPLRLTHDHLARVPLPPGTLNPSVPDSLSAIILHLLEKEPDNRYQTTEGLLHDLERLDRVAHGREITVGQHDFPARLRPPSHPIGRDAEIDALRDAFTAALTGDCRGVLVSGRPGVGKTMLVNELRPVVTASNGWFVSGKFDRSRRDLQADGVRQAFRDLGRLLLAEPDSQLQTLREQLRTTVGADLGWVAAVLPEFASLLQVEPAAPSTDPVVDLGRSQRALTNLLRAVAAAGRPIVMFIDDLQWAGRSPLRFMERILSGEVTIPGVLLVGAYRSDQIDPYHPLPTMVARWRRDGGGPKHLTLSNLSVTELAALLADVLRVGPEPARQLATAIAPRTGGNPYDTLELLNALRRDGLLTPGKQGWRWDIDAVRHHVGAQSDLQDVLASRATALSPRTRELVEYLACLGGRVELATLAVATGRSVEAVERDLAPALSDGLLVMEPGARDTVRFRHDVTWEAILRRMAPEQELAMRLQLARRLADHPDLFAAAAEQYLSAIPAVTDPDEQRRASQLLRRAAEQARMVGNYALVERLLAAALPLVDPEDRAALIELHTGRHAALFGLGRLEEANHIYRQLEALTDDPFTLLPAALTQISSLTNQNRPQEAIALGLSMLRQLGVAQPDRIGLAETAEHGLEVVHRWLTSPEADVTQPADRLEATPAAVASLINRILPPAFFSDSLTFAWLTVTAMEMWAEHGPSRTLVGPVSHVPYVLSAHDHDLRAGREVLRRVRAVSEAEGWEPESSQAKFLYALGVGHWFEPIEEVVPQARQARIDLLRGGDQQNPTYTYYATVVQLFDYASNLKRYQAEVDAALRDAIRAGNEQAADAYRAYRCMVDVLRGVPHSRAAEPSLTAAQTSTANAYIRITKALTAALFDNPAELERQSSAVMPLLPAIEATYATVTAHLLRGLALAHQARTAAPDQRVEALAALDATIEWFAARSEDAPDNLWHLQRLLEAERAWAAGQFQYAVTAFDAALHDVGQRRRPWHRALILERAGKFYLAHGVRYAAHVLLAEARRAYQAWGATAKADRLDWAYPGLPSNPLANEQTDDGSVRRPRLGSGTIDLLAILDASRALSSETGVEGLRSRVIEVLSAMTGATGVELLLTTEGEQGWQLATGDTHVLAPLDDNDPHPPVPMSAVRYVERTGEPLVVRDATRDARFARDPYFAGLDRCSLLVVPILSRGRLQALLILENRLLRGAFSGDRLDTVKLIAGQLAVSLDNARLNSSLEQMVAERTEALAVANRRLEQLSITDALTGLANRRRLEEVLDIHWRRARRARRPLALAMVDIDHFKLYNDYYGHAAGDRALQRIATLLKENIRETDLVARFGGEEFAVVMPDTDLAEASQVAQRLHSAVMRLAEPHELVNEGIVTVSIGVAALVPEAGTSPDTLFELADVELYRAKRKGRNQIRVAQL